MLNPVTLPGRCIRSCMAPRGITTALLPMTPFMRKTPTRVNRRPCNSRTSPAFLCNASAAASPGAAYDKAVLRLDRLEKRLSQTYNCPMAIADLRKVREQTGLDLCGEEGEYHTLVTDGPHFQRRIAIRSASTRANCPNL